MRVLNLGSGGADGFLLYIQFFLDHVSLNDLPDQIICSSASALALFFVFIMSDIFKLFDRDKLRRLCNIKNLPSKLDLLLHYDDFIRILSIKTPPEIKEYTLERWFEDSRGKDLNIITTHVGALLKFKRKIWNRISDPNAKLWDIVTASCNVIPSLKPNTHIDGWYSGEYFESTPNSNVMFVRIHRKFDEKKQGVIYLNWHRKYIVSLKSMTFCIKKFE